MTFAGKWMELKITILSKISQAHKATCHRYVVCLNTYIYGSSLMKPTKDCLEKGEEEEGELRKYNGVGKLCSK
jgi:hypothetical protein